MWLGPGSTVVRSILEMRCAAWAAFFYCAVGLHHPWSTLPLRPTTDFWLLPQRLLVCNRSSPSPESRLLPPWRWRGVAPSSRLRLGLKTKYSRTTTTGPRHHLRTPEGTITAAEHARRQPFLLPPAPPPPSPAPLLLARPRNGVARREIR